MPRAVPEWIGRTPDSPVPARVKLRILRQHDNRCYLTGREIRPGDAWEVEHVKALFLGGENRETNLAPALADAHKRKTQAEMAVKAKTDRVAQKHMGIKKKSRGFQKPEGVRFDWQRGRYVKEQADG